MLRQTKRIAPNGLPKDLWEENLLYIELEDSSEMRASFFMKN
jgi:hypothetical protein